MRIAIGHKFIIGFILVVGAVVLIPYGVAGLDLPEWAQRVIPTVAAIAVGLTIGSLVTRTLTRNVKGLLRATRNIAQGDLRYAVDLGRRPLTDELDDVVASVNGMLTSLRQMVTQVLRTSSEVTGSAQSLSASAEQINVSSEEIAVTMGEVAKGVEHQRESLEQMGELIRAQAGSIEEVACTCREAALSAREAEEKAQAGGRTAAETFEHLNAVLKRLEESTRVFMAFSDRIRQIHRIAEVITNLSRQTNLLALNAAIEASKAGDEGKGFAVVAGEIRKLADSAERSADQISGLVGKLDEETRQVSRLMEVSSRQVAGGREGLQIAGKALGEITGLVSQNTQRVDEILRRTQEQADGSRRLVEFVDRIERVAESNAAATHEVSATVGHQTLAMDEMARAAVRLSETAEELSRRAESFRVPTEDRIPT